MKVCLIFPPVGGDIRKELAAIFPPHGLLCIASCIERAGHQVSVIDCIVDEIGYSELEDRIRKFSPDVVGVSILSANRFAGFECAKIAKKIDRNLTTVFGGAHATWYDKEILEHYPDIDIVVRGEGEETFIDLIETSNKKDVLGITYRDDCKIVQNSDRPSIKDIDSIPFPAFHLVHMERYFVRAKIHEKFLRNPASMIMIARGCLAKCTFCSTPGIWKGIRVHSPEYVISNIEYLHKNWGVKDVLICDDTFPLSEKWFNEFYIAFKEKDIDLTFRCLSRVNVVDKEILTKMKELGCYFVQYGIESGSDKVLKRVKKGINVDQVRKAFDATHKAGIMSGMFLMVGFPEEDLSDIYETLKLARSLNSYDLYMGVTMILPGAELWREMGGKDNPWFSEYNVNSSLERSTFKVFPAYESEFFTRDELNYLVLNIVHQFNIHNFFRRVYFNLKTNRKSCFDVFKKLISELIINAASMNEYPFEKFEKRRHWILDGMLRKIYKCFLFMRSTLLSNLNPFKIHGMSSFK